MWHRILYAMQKWVVHSMSAYSNRNCCKLNKEPACGFKDCTPCKNRKCTLCLHTRIPIAATAADDSVSAALERTAVLSCRSTHWQCHKTKQSICHAWHCAQLLPARHTVSPYCLSIHMNDTASVVQLSQLKY